MGSERYLRGERDLERQMEEVRGNGEAPVPESNIFGQFPDFGDNNRREGWPAQVFLPRDGGKLEVMSTVDGVRIGYVDIPPNGLLSSPSSTQLQLSSVLCSLATSGPPLALPASSSSANRRQAARLVTATPFTWKKLGRLGLSSSSAQPTPRHGHRAVIHKESMIVYGGGNDGIFSGLHVLNLASLQWSKPTLQGNGPEGLAAFGMIVNHGKITIFGGAKERCYTNELWQLDLSTWTWMQLEQKAAQGGEIPCPRIGHSFTLAPPNKNEVANEIYVFGGLSGNRMERGEPSRYLDDLYILNEVDKRGIWRVPITFGTPPSHRESHSAVTHVHVSSNGNVRRLIVFGGAINGVRLRDCYVLDLDTKHWLQVVLSAISPTPRSLHSANVIGKKMFIFGGWVPEEETDKKSSEIRNKWRCSNSLECLDLETFQWESIQDYVKQEKSGHPPRPLPRAGHCAVAYNGSLFLLSGRNGYVHKMACFNDLWELEVERVSVSVEEGEQPTPPPPPLPSPSSLLPSTAASQAAAIANVKPSSRSLGAKAAASSSTSSVGVYPPPSSYRGAKENVKRRKTASHTVPAPPPPPPAATAVPLNQFDVLSILPEQILMTNDGGITYIIIPFYKQDTATSDISTTPNTSTVTITLAPGSHEPPVLPETEGVPASSSSSGLQGLPIMDTSPVQRPPSSSDGPWSC